MGDYRRNQTHEADGVDRLLERFKGTPKFEALVRIFLKRAQHIDDVLWDLYTGVWLDNAVGVQLDNLGDIVGEPRRGRQDDQFRVYIRARVKINRSDGKVADILDVARLILEPTAKVTYTPDPPAGYRIDVSNTAVNAHDVAAILDQVRPAGVGATTQVAADLSHAFIFNTSTPLVNGFNHGLLADRV